MISSKAHQLRPTVPSLPMRPPCQWKFNDLRHYVVHQMHQIRFVGNKCRMPGSVHSRILVSAGYGEHYCPRALSHEPCALSTICDLQFAILCSSFLDCDSRNFSHISPRTCILSSSLSSVAYVCAQPGHSWVRLKLHSL